MAGLTSTDAPSAPPTQRRTGRGVDVAIALALGVVAAVPRAALPGDGFFFDDAWQAAGVVRGSLADLPLVGQTQPGFTALLMVWVRLVGSSEAALVAPVYIAGVLGGPALYYVLRRLGSGPALAAFVAAALVASETHVAYSGRVKTYTLDVLVVLGLVVALLHLGRRTWTPRTAVVWILGASAVATVSSIALLTAGCAGLVAALHPCRDRWVRLAALAGQASFAGVLLLVTRRSVDVTSISAHFEARGAMIGHHDPWNVPRRVASHLHNAVESLVDGPGTLAWIVLLVAVLGVVAMALRGPEVIVGRFLVLCLAAAVLGSIGDVLPMGSPLDSLHRLNLWLFPIFAVGFAHAVHAVAASPRVRLRVVAPALGAALAVALGWRALQVDVTYPPFGYRAAADEVLGDLGVDDLVWVSRFQTYGFALEPDLEARIVRQTERNVGFAFRFDDPRIVGTSYDTTDAELLASLGPDVERVRVVTMGFFGDDVNRARFADLLTQRGFGLVEERPVGGSVVSTWAREDA